MLSGAANNYQFPYEIGILRREDRLVGNGQRHGGFRYWKAKAYQDIACKTVQEKYGITSCFNCPLSECRCKESEL